MLLADGFLTDTWRDVIGIISLFIGGIGLWITIEAMRAAVAAKEAAVAAKKESEERFKADTAHRAIHKANRAQAYIGKQRWELVAEVLRDLADELGGFIPLATNDQAWQDDLESLYKMANECDDLASGMRTQSHHLKWREILRNLAVRLHPYRRPS
jgi:hypothetical protein